MSAQTVRIPNRVFPAWKTLTKSIRMAIADEQNIVPDNVRAEDVFDRLINLAASGLGVSTLTSPTMEEIGAVHGALDEHRCRIGALEAAVYRMDAASRGANPVASGGMRMDAGISRRESHCQLLQERKARHPQRHASERPTDP